MFPRGSRFQFVEGAYEGGLPALSCDGLVPGASLDLTHWQGNRTPPHYKADTSTEIALRFAASPDSSAWVGAVVVNNHFDTDGLLSAWSLLEPERAAEDRALLVAAAEAGDFEEWPGDDRGLRLDAAIRALAAEAGDDAQAYARLLPQLPGLLRTLDARRDLWGREWDALQEAVRALEEGDGLEMECLATIGVCKHAPGRAEVPGPLLARQFLPGARAYLLVFEQAGGAFAYRYERPRYAWADTVVRPPCPAPDASALAASLGPDWTHDGLPGMTGIVQTRRPIADVPAAVAARLIRSDERLR